MTLIEETIEVNSNVWVDIIQNESVKKFCGTDDPEMPPVALYSSRRENGRLYNNLKNLSSLTFLRNDDVTRAEGNILVKHCKTTTEEALAVVMRHITGTRDGTD